MILGFFLNSESDQFQKMIVIVPIPQGALNIDLFLRKKAASQMPFGGQTQAITHGTEVIAHSPDKPDFSFSTPQGESLRRAVKEARLDGS